MSSKRTYPHFTTASQHTFLQRLRARISRCPIHTSDNPIFLGHCPGHGYFHDHEHTNGEIRCPGCHQHWLKKQKIAEP